MMRILTTVGLVRHGITEWNELGRFQGTSDIDLNEAGRKQAEAIAERIAKGENWDVIISSHLSRAKETAQIIAAKLEDPILLEDKRIMELNCGEMEGTTEEERIEKWGENWSDIDLGMEPFENVARRGMDFLKELNETYKGKRVLVVSHGALIGLTLQNLLPDKFNKTYIDNTSLTILRNRLDNWNCELFNCTKHLQ